jgi:hypothetical protein
MPMRRTAATTYSFITIFIFSLFFCCKGYSNEKNSDERPKFSSYPANQELEIKTIGKKQLNFKKNTDKKYRTAIHRAIGQPPNFSGNFYIVTKGCGTDCRGFAIVDLISGDVYTPSHIKLVAGAPNNNQDRIEYKKDSRLLVLNGILNDEEQKEGSFFYLWNGKYLRFLKKLPLEKIETEEEAP